MALRRDTQPSGIRAGHVLLIAAAVPAIVLVCSHLFYGNVGADGWMGFDFRNGIVRGARHMLDGRSPYELSYIRAHVADAPAGASFPAYPAPGTLIGIPFLAFPAAVANVLIVALLLPVPAVAMRLLGASDWRCYALAYSSLPTISALELGTVTPLVLLGVAMAWRFGQQAKGGLALGAVIVLKLFPWPLVLVLMAMRRMREALLAAVCLGITAGAWIIVSPSTAREYLDVARGLAAMQQQRGLSFVAFGVDAGLSPSAARVLMLAVGVGLLGAAMWIATTSHLAAEAYSVGMCAALALTPIVWNHYFLLCLVPLVLLYPRFSWHWWLAWAVGWFLPAIPGQAPPGATLALPLVCAAVLAVAVRRHHASRTAERRSPARHAVA
ncbi:MAG: alpha,2-mannosyltransferase [Gaiellales bacterium]|nr:alpha,2-mannosyltransferase [Gaiellales bacterium]